VNVDELDVSAVDGKEDDGDDEATGTRALGKARTLAARLSRNRRDGRQILTQSDIGHIAKRN